MDAKHLGMSMLVAAITVAIIFRVEPVKKIVVGA